MNVSVPRFTLVALAAAALLTACAGQTSTPIAASPATSTLAPAEPDPTDVPTSPAAAQPEVVFHILAEESEARFFIDEILRGSPNTVVGVTNAVSGEIRIQTASPTQSTLGPIEIEAATLSTDNGFRNGAINNFILQTGEFPTITFAPTSIGGLPAAVSPGDSLSFTVSGDLTVRDVTVPVTFNIDLAAESPTRLTGLARATILRSDFELTIPSVPSVADVSDEVILEFEFVAQAS